MRSRVLSWRGGEHEFALSVPSLEALQDRCGGDGVGLIYQRLTSGTYRVSDVIATLTLGLQGGGMDRLEAAKKVETLAEDHGLTTLRPTATLVLSGALLGWPDDEGADDDLGEDGVETPKTS